MSTLPDGIIVNIIKYMAVGASVGSLFGLWNTYSNNSSQPENFDTKRNTYENIKLDSHAEEIMNKFGSYAENINPDLYDEIAYNLDRLISLQVLINQGKVNVNFPHKATRYFYNIKYSTKKIKSQLRQILTPTMNDDIKEIMNIASNYVNNITLDTDSYIMSQHRNK